MVIRTQKDRKLQTLIEVCTDFASLSHTANVHRPAEQVFALEEDDNREEEMFAVVDRQQWNTRRAAEPPLSPELQQMFTLARRMGYEMRPIARRLDAPRQTPGPQSSPNKEYRAPFRPRDYLRTKCFSCGQLGHTQVRCPKPDSSLPFRPDGWVKRSMDHSDVTADPHRPVCHQFGPRFITDHHPRSSPEKFICLHTPWRFNH